LLKVLLVAGARPNFVKVAAVLRALSAAGHRALLVHTGQHYDPVMTDSFFRDLDLPDPDYCLGVGSDSHVQQPARVMERFEPVLLDVRPDWVVVVGDVNSTLACALVAAKLKHELGCGLAHVEAGLRSGDWRMPEELNRVLTDRVSDVLFVPSSDALANLSAEGIDPGRIVMVGNVMIDTLFAMLFKARELDFAKMLSLTRGIVGQDRLMPCHKVDDGEPPEAEAAGAIFQVAVVVWSTVGDRGRHPTQDRAIDRRRLTVVEDTADSTHGGRSGGPRRATLTQ